MASILPPEMSGVMYETGPRGYGKSYLASQADFPENICYLDFEKKGEGIDTNLNFGMYRSLTEDENASPQVVYNKFQQALSDIPKGKFTVCILDNISPLELAMKAEVRNNLKTYCQMYALNEANILASRFGGLSSVVNFLVSDKICNPLFSKGIKLVIAIAHTSGKWGPGGVIPGKLNGKGADRWQELSILSLIIIPGEKPPVPAAIVQKEQLGTISISPDRSPEHIAAIMRGEEGHSIQRRLPVRIPDATFQKIRWYLSHPADLKSPAPGETPTPEEIEPYTEKLSKEQYEIMRLALAKEERESKQEAEILKIAQEIDPVRKSALQMKSDGKTPIQIAQELNIPLPEVARMLAK